jgi:predicted ATPase
MPPDLPTGLVTFLFTDIEGSTRLLDELGSEGYAAALAEHRAVIREACAASGGVEVDTQGDAFFVAFPTAAGALAAAGAIGEGLAAGPIAVRIGIHSGTPTLTDAGYVGADVHLGARIATAGSGGQVLVSGATRALVEAELTDLGEHRLKDFGEAVPIFQLGTLRFPPLRTISNTNLPRPASSFVGRETEVTEVAALLSDGARLLTLTGPGGSGKTRLAIETAASLVPSFRAGVFWVDLAPLREPALVAETIGQTLGAKDGMADHIGEREMLLLLDNLEQVIAAAPELASLVEACPHLRLLVTSRERLRVRGEHEYPVSPLAEPEAVELFCARSGLLPTTEIDELCRALDNLPLAIELAAARSSVLRPAQITERLSQRLDLLRGGRDADPRQATLRATIEWSYELLTPDEQRLFARLSVFRGGCTLEAAERVADADLDSLSSLVDKSLLRHVDERFVMLETIRDYASERLTAAGEADDLRRRHADFFLALAEEAEPHLRAVALRGGVHEVEWLARLDREHDNLRAALDRLGDGGETQLVLRIAGALVEYWFERANFVELRQRLVAALAADDRPTAARAKALIGMADALGVGNDNEGSRRVSEEALAIYRAIGDRAGTADALWRLGSAIRHAGDVRDGLPLLEEAKAIFNEVDDRQSALNVSRGLAWAYEQLGDRERAEKLYRENLDLARSLDNRYVAHASLGALSTIAVEDGRTREALGLAHEHLPMPDDFGRLELSTSFERAAYVLAHAGRCAAAASLLGKSESIAREIHASQPWTAPFHERTRAIAMEELGDVDFAEAWERGCSMTDDEARAFAFDALGWRAL